VKVTDWPKTEGLVADVTDALVASWLTVWVRAGGGAGREVGVTLVDGVTGWLATERLDVVKVATPPARVPCRTRWCRRRRRRCPSGCPLPGWWR